MAHACHGVAGGHRLRRHGPGRFRTSQDGHGVRFLIALHDFHGGLHQPGKKDLSNREPIRRLEATGTLILPLHMHIGQPARPLIEPGDRVGLG
ncbi:MAG: hypothetical protein ACOC00_08560, partial [Halothiobacillaceae bacterium]